MKKKVKRQNSTRKARTNRLNRIQSGILAAFPNYTFTELIGNLRHSIKSSNILSGSTSPHFFPYLKQFYQSVNSKEDLEIPIGVEKDVAIEFS